MLEKRILSNGIWKMAGLRDAENIQIWLKGMRPSVQKQRVAMFAMICVLFSHNFLRKFDVYALALRKWDFYPILSGTRSWTNILRKQLFCFLMKIRCFESRKEELYLVYRKKNWWFESNFLFSHILHLFFNLKSL